MKSQRKSGALYVALSGVFFGLIGYFGMNIIHAQVSINTMLFWRFLVASLFMCFILLVQMKSWVATPKDLLKALFYGAIFYGPSSALYFVSASEMGSGLAMVLFYTFPAMVMFLNFVVYKQPIGYMYYWATGLLLMGMLLLVNGSPGQLNWMGAWMGLLSALFFALYIIVSKHSSAPAQVDTLMVCLGSMLSGFVAAKYSHSFTMPVDVNFWVNVVGIGIICTSIPILLLLKGLKHIGAIEASILSVLEPVFVIIFGVTLLGETIHLTQFIGVIILLLGALLAILPT